MLIYQKFMKKPLSVAAGVFTALVIERNRDVVAYILRTRGAFDANSAHIIFRYGLLPSALAALICLLAWGLGLRLLRLLNAEDVAERDLIGYGLGIGTLGSASLLMGLCGAFGPAAFLTLGSLAAIAGVSDMLRRVRAEPLFRQDQEVRALWQGFLAGIIAFVLWHAFITGLAPVNDWDALAYHLALPKIYLRSGRILGLPWLLHSHWPHLMEVLYAVPLSLGMDNAAALLHAAAIAAMVLATLRAGRRWLGAPAGWMAAAILAAQPSLWMYAGAAHSDGVFAMFHFLACVALWSWAESGSRRILIVAALLSGLAAATKLLGILPLSVLCAWVWVRSRREKGAAPALLFAACGLAVVLPWYIKTWAADGNPIWPFLSHWLGGRWGAASFESRLVRATLLDWPPPLGLIFQYGPQYLLVPAAIGAAWAWLRRLDWPPFLKFLLTPAACFFLVIARQTECWRYMLPMLPALALTAGWGMARLGQGRVGRIVAAGLVLFALYPIREATHGYELCTDLGLRPISEPDVPPREAYLQKTVEHYRAYGRVSGLMGARDKVLLFREIRGYYLDADYMWGDPLNQGVLRYAELNGPEALAGELSRLGVTHVLDNEESGLYGESPFYYDRRTLDMMRDMLRRHGRPVLRDGSLMLYMLI